jgi:hypothetical protein
VSYEVGQERTGPAADVEQVVVGLQVEHRGNAYTRAWLCGWTLANTAPTGPSKNNASAPVRMAPGGAR